MATSKSGAKSRTAKKTTATKSTTRSASTATKVTTKTAPAKQTVVKKETGTPNFPAIILAEIIGTFVLTLIALLSLSSLGALYVGITLAVIVLAIGAVSGAHINPAVTFGLWAARKVKTVLVPVYWLAQFIGAILAVLLLGLFTGYGYPLDFSHFGTINWGILAAELIGTAVFLFGLVAAVSSDKLSQVGKAFGVGLSLTLGVLVSTSILTTVQTGKYEEYSAAAQNTTTTTQTATEIPAELYVKGATLNPAVALAATENTESQLNGSSATQDEPRYTRLGLEVIIGTLVGAALGANLYLLLAFANRQQNV